MKKFKYSNVLYFIISILLLIVSLIYINKSYSNSQVNILFNKFGLILTIVLSILFVIFEIIYLVIKNKYFNIQKIKNIVYLILIIYAMVFFLSIILGNLYEAFKIAASLSKKPNSTYSLLIRLAYIILNDYSQLLSGIWTTIYISLLGTIIGFAIALIFLIIKTNEIKTTDNEILVFLKNLGRTFVNIYVNVFRGTPMMVQAIIIYYFLPGILSSIFKIDQTILNKILSVSISGLITVSLNTAAYLTEVLRGGLDAVNKGQYEAARSLGMKRHQSLSTVILPQTIKNSLPSICNEFIINIKDTSVLSVISVIDLFFVINQINGRAQNQDAIFIAAIVYLIMTLGISKLLKIIERKMKLQAKPIPSSN